MKTIDLKFQPCAERMNEPTCSKHPGVKLICPKCRSAKGGRNTARRHSAAQLARWGKMGGRPPKDSEK